MSLIFSRRGGDDYESPHVRYYVIITRSQGLLLAAQKQVFNKFDEVLWETGRCWPQKMLEVERSFHSRIIIISISPTSLS